MAIDNLNDYIETLFKPISGYYSYKQNEQNEYKQQGIYPTYGEILDSGISQLIKHLNLTEQDVFLDLGSGIGRCTLSILLNSSVKHAIGIEAIEKRFNDAEMIKQQIIEHQPDLFADKNLEFKLGNFIEIGFEPATVVYACSTSFGDDLLEKIASLIDSNPQIRALASLRKVSHLNRLKFHETIDIACSWDSNETCHIYTKF